MLEFRKPFPEEMDKVYSLRYRVYGLEKNFVNPQDYPDGRESDCYDQHSVHLIAIETDHGDGALLGVMRLVLGPKILESNELDLTLPVASHFELNRPLDLENSAELSRLIVAPEARHLTFQILSGLIRGAYQSTCEYGVNDLYAVLETPLLRMLRRLGLPFEDAGIPCWYMGAITNPVELSVRKTIEVLPKTNAMLYDYMTASDKTFETIL